MPRTNTFTNEHGIVTTWIQQQEINDIFQSEYQGKVIYNSYPRTMEVDAEWVGEDVKPADFDE